MSYIAGSLVKIRGREWIVLPESDKKILMLRPLGGTDDEIAGIYIPLEKDNISSAEFNLPDPEKAGDHTSCKMLRDATRLGFRSSSGPLRSFGKISVEPRPYQIVPLLMALRLDPVRLLIADDVGIGKTIEAGLIVRELLDRGEIQRFSVICPPQLAEQWQKELQEKFHINAELVLPTTISRLEAKTLDRSQSIFDVYSYTIVSLDYIKSDRRRDDFLQYAPECIIIDEAHTAVQSSGKRGKKHQRYKLVKGLSERENQHLILVTATPHSGNEDAFKSLLSLLDNKFESLPNELSGKKNQSKREEVAKHFIQRTRGDIISLDQKLGRTTKFPEVIEVSESYSLSQDYKKLFDDVIAYAKERVSDTTGSALKQRIRWWSVLALLRAFASSPAAAYETLKRRAATIDAISLEDVNEIGVESVFDQDNNEGMDVSDFTPGADISDIEKENDPNQKTFLLNLAEEAEKLCTVKKDFKLKNVINYTKKLLKDGYSPIIFCRFIHTAEYVAQMLRKKLKSVDVVCITGNIAPSERESIIEELPEDNLKVLVCTDCLSEGINLQTHFNALIHYDLTWNPTRLEQREGRINRFNQKSEDVRILTYYGKDNQIDGIVLNVLLRKHKSIKSALGISVPIPTDTGEVMEAILRGLLLSKNKQDTPQLPFLADEFNQYKVIEDMNKLWDQAALREEKTSRSLFSQSTIKSEEIISEIDLMNQSLGSIETVKDFLFNALKASGAIISEKKCYHVDLSGIPVGLKDLIGDHRIKIAFELPVPQGATYINRTHPLVSNVASYVLDTALDQLFQNSIATRSGVIFTDFVAIRTTLLVVRFRYLLKTVQRSGAVKESLIEDCKLLAFKKSPKRALWLEEFEAEQLLSAQPKANIIQQKRVDEIGNVVGGMEEYLMPYIKEFANRRGEEILKTHHRIRMLDKRKGSKQGISNITINSESFIPDVLGIFVFLPV